MEVTQRQNQFVSWSARVDPLLRMGLGFVFRIVAPGFLEILPRGSALTIPIFVLMDIMDLLIKTYVCYPALVLILQQSGISLKILLKLVYKNV